MHRVACQVLLLLAVAGGATAASPISGASADQWAPPFAGNPCIASDAVPGHQLEFNAYFEREADAQGVARALPSEVFALTVRRSAEGHDWILIARYHELPKPGDHAAHSERIHALARAAGGRYPGFVCAGPPYRPGDSSAAPLQSSNSLP
jgi:hypothetical protein